MSVKFRLKDASTDDSVVVDTARAIDEEEDGDGVREGDDLEQRLRE